MNDSEKPQGALDEIKSLGEKYELSSERFIRIVSKKPVGTVIMKEKLMKELIGDDYDAMTEPTRNMIFMTLIQPELEAAIEYGIVKETGDGEYTR